jgi:glyoxylase-like metal-dependent hydrolase (beta-lactamase superfamily II)
MVDIRVISIGCLSAHPLWGERGGAGGASSGVRTGHATTTLIRSGDVTLLIDPGLPEAAIAARLHERAGLSPDRVTHVFLTSFHPDTHRGILAFPQATWLISRDEREGVGIPLIQQLKFADDKAEAGTGEPALVERLKHQVAILQRCQEAPEELAPRVDLFPLPGLTPGLCGVLVEEEDSTVLVCGDAVPTVEHLRRRMVLPQAADVDKARASFAEALQIGDDLILGRDNWVRNPFDARGEISPED